jgi:hypothetical protein
LEAFIKDHMLAYLNYKFIDLIFPSLCSSS